MGMSNAEAIWIETTAVKPSTLIEPLRSLLERGVRPDIWTRGDPNATFVTLGRDPHPDLARDCLGKPAVELARLLGCRAWHVRAFAGSNDWIGVTAFSPTGARRWTSGSNPQLRKLPANVLKAARALDLTAGIDRGEGDADDEYDVDETNHPYWLMVSELTSARRPREYFTIGVVPLLEPRAGWKRLAGWAKAADAVTAKGAPAREAEALRAQAEQAAHDAEVLRLAQESDTAFLKQLDRAFDRLQRQVGREHLYGVAFTIDARGWVVRANTEERLVKTTQKDARQDLADQNVWQRWACVVQRRALSS